MHRTKSLSKAFVVAAVLAVTITPFMASTASAKTATTTATGCKASVQPGAEIGLYPAFDGAESSFVAACTFEYDSTAQEVSGNFHIEDFANVNWHNGASRSLTIASKTAGTASPFVAPTITVTDPASGTCTELAGYKGHTVSANFQTLGHGLKADTFITAISGCTITLNQPFQASGPTGTILIENGYAHTVPSGATPNLVGAKTTAGSCVVQDLPADPAETQSLSTDAVGLSVSGTNIPRYATLSAVNPGVSWTFTAPGGACALATGTDQQFSIGGATVNATDREIRDSAASWSGTVLTSLVPKFNTADTGNVGLKITTLNGTGCTTPNYIMSITVNNKANLAFSETGCTATQFDIGEASITAPLNGDVVLNQSVALDLSPSLVDGSDDCSYEHVEGFGIAGEWANPGSFLPPSLFLVAQPDKTQALAQITFATSVITYAGYVLQYGAGGAGQQIGVAHVTMDFPGTPTTAALCGPGTGYTLTSTSPGLGFSIHVPAVTASQSAIGSGIGKPSSAQLRNTVLSATKDGASSSTGYVVDDSGTPTLPWNTGALAPNFNRLCIEPSNPTPLPLVDFHCGQ